uniref:Exocyst subunit Exo70 family protein n=1 Tax=Davidia involucrata TaxID=16924 RepID=A0A5B7AG13_DAVIN
MTSIETEKGKHLPEESPRFAPIDGGAGDKNNDNSQHDHDHDHNEDQNHDSENVPPPEPEMEVEAKADDAKTENKEEEISEINIPPDLSKVSEEIDQFIFALSSAKRDESEPPEVPESVEQYAVLVEAKIANHDSGENPVKWSQVAEEDSSSFLEVVDRISKLTTSLSELSSESKYAWSINRIGGIQQRAMSYLEDEFRSLLEDIFSDHNNYDSKTKQWSSSSTNQEADSCPLPDSDSTGESNFPGYSDEVVSNLNKLAKAMISGGYEIECCQVYIVVRRQAFEERLQKLGFEMVSVDDVQKMQWESLEREIVSWIKTFRECTAVYLSSERKLSETVFSDYQSISDSLFSSFSRAVMIQFLNFAEAVAMTKRSAEKLFKFLDIYETLRDLIPTMDNLFPDECVDEIKSEASLTRSRLGETMVCIFCELENSIKADTGKTPVPGGAVHPLTRYTMNYLKYACEYKETLEQVFREHQNIERADPATGSDYDYNAQSDEQRENQSPFAMQIFKVMDLLDTNLESKSKLYKDTSLSLIFMMNNGRYILQKIKGAAEMNDLMRETWCRKRSSDLRQYHKNYQRETWAKLLHCLTHEGLNVHGKVVKPVLKERFKSFNAMFDEIHKAQSTWVVSDEQLQSELRVSISAVVIPAYRSFLARFNQYLTPGRQTEKYIKYQPEDIETYIDELFDGNAGRRRQ